MNQSNAQKSFEIEIKDPDIIDSQMLNEDYVATVMYKL